MARSRSTADHDDTSPASPAARRATGARWLDLRMLIGLALVVASVVAGAKIVSASDKTVTVWAVTRDLAAGTTLTDSDVRAVDVRLDEQASSYLATSSDPTGRTLVRDVGSGDLLPAKAVGKVDELVALALSVPASRVPVTVQRGDRVTLYASDPKQAGDAAAAVTAIVAEAVTVAEVSERSQGALSVGSGELQVVIKVRSCAVTKILDGTVERVLTLVEVPSGTTAGSGC